MDWDGVGGGQLLPCEPDEPEWVSPQDDLLYQVRLFIFEAGLGGGGHEKLTLSAVAPAV
mgnify:FL=1